MALISAAFQRFGYLVLLRQDLICILQSMVFERSYFSLCLSCWLEPFSRMPLFRIEKPENTPRLYEIGDIVSAEYTPSSATLENGGRFCKPS